jgi:Protein of unknown function (DUF3568)
MRPILVRQLVLGGMALVMLANGGCLAAAVGAGVAAAGGTAGYLYFKGNVPDDFNANFDATWAATKTALADLRMPVVRENRDGQKGTLETKTGTSETVTLYLETRANKVPADGPITRVHVRVGTLGDEKVSDRLLEQIAFRLSPPPPLPQTATAGRPAANNVAPVGFQTAPPPLANPQPPGYPQPK